MDQVSLGWLVFDRTESPFMVGVATAARMAPLFFLGILSGAIADRVDRRVFLRLITICGSVVAAAMALLLLLDVGQIWHVLVLASAMGACFAFMLTVRQAYTYDIVGPERALNGMSLASLAQGFGGMIGAIISGIIIATLGVGEQYLAISISYIAATAVLLGTRPGGQAAQFEREPVLQSLQGYFQILRQNRTLLILMCLASTTELLGFTHQSLLPVFAKEVLGVGPVGLGVMTAVRQGGMIIGLMFLANLGNSPRKGLLAFIFPMGFGLGLMGFSLSENIYIFLVILAVVNGCAAAADTLYKTLMQNVVPNEQRGRAMGSWVLSIGVAPVGHIGVGAMAGGLGAQGALLINGSILALAGLTTALGLPKIRRLP